MNPVVRKSTSTSPACVNTYSMKCCRTFCRVQALAIVTQVYSTKNNIQLKLAQDSSDKIHNKTVPYIQNINHKESSRISRNEQD